MNERSNEPRPDAAPDEQTGRLLEEWLRDEAPAHEPPVLIPSTRARVAFTRRRPGWLIRDWWLWRPGRSRKGFLNMNFATQLIAVAVLALSGTGLFMVAVEPGQDPVTQPGAPDPNEAAVAVTGSTSGFKMLHGGEYEFLGNGLMTNRGMRYEGPWTLSDPRLSGTWWSIHDFVDLGADLEGSAGKIISGAAGIENDVGSWSGTFRGYETPGQYEDDHYFLELEGSGAYEGLSAVLMMIDQGDTWDLQGMIYPGEPLPYPAVD